MLAAHTAAAAFASCADRPPPPALDGASGFRAQWFSFDSCPCLGVRQTVSSRIILFRECRQPLWSHPAKEDAQVSRTHRIVLTGPPADFKACR